MTDDSAVFIYLSNGLPTRNYDQDIADETRAQFPQAKVVTIGCNIEGAAAPDVLFDGVESDIWNAALFVLFAQRLAVDWSMAAGLHVDNPFIDKGNLSRVVSHVQLYA